MAASLTVEANYGAEVVTDSEHPELGNFLRASSALKCGDLIVKESPLFRLRGGGGRRMPPDSGAAASAMRSVEMFVPSTSSSVLKRLRKQAAKDEEEDTFFVRSVMQFNSFAAGVGGMDKVTFAMLAKANHSCAPNCIVDGDEGTLRAIQTISKGDALTISYLSDAQLLKNRQQRRDILADGWDFHCRCSRCNAVDVSGEDVRRFAACCPDGGDALAHCKDGATVLQGLNCGTILPAPTCAELLSAEKAASRSLKAALAGDLEEEEEGQELIRCQTFAQMHPLHHVSLELAVEFAFPDAVEAKQGILRGLRSVLGDVPTQLAVDTSRELADLLHQKGDTAAAQAALTAAAAVAAILDGRSSADEVLQEWQRSARDREQRPSAALAGPPLANRDTAWLAREMDLDMGFKPASAPVTDAPADCGGSCQCREKDFEISKSPVTDVSERAQRWSSNVQIASLASACVLVGLLSFWRFRNRNLLP